MNTCFFQRQINQTAFSDTICFMEYIIYSDESVSKGEFFSDFFGGALVTNRNFNEVNAALEAKKLELNLTGEIKWTKVSVAYLEKYKQMMDLFFSFVKQNKVKLRIMFQESGHSYDPLHQDQIVNRYHLLYYQFIKHAFGLRCHDASSGETVYLKLYFDKMPVSIQESDAFKAHIAYLQNLWQFRKAHIVIRPDDIAEVDSHKHCIQQCMDIVLGSIAFRLNNKHLVIPPGATEPGHKTKAKESLFNHILELIKNADGIEDFDISKTTLPDQARDRWIIPYRHWKFLAAEFRQKTEG